MKGFCPLASGSKGNCVFLGTDNTKILIDAGLSTKATKKKLEEIDVDIGEIDAILISHEHSDHIQGLKVMANKMKIPVFANTETAKGIVNSLRDCPQFKIFTTGESFEFRDLEIHPFTVPHDTLDPVMFTIKTNGLKLGFCTDLGFATSRVKVQLQDCDYLLLEANHQREMVHACPRPEVYKRRVLGRTGHLSNIDCGNLICEIAHPGLKHIHLAHLSSECNTPEKAIETVKEIMKSKGLDIDLCIAPQDQISKSIHF
ncbi:MAG: MBL fold metallo-hydrolase [Chlamydiota bacterium]|nr:MBL fold metallo-hydrolase [Chlamydiota bacterium]